MEWCLHICWEGEVSKGMTQRKGVGNTGYAKTGEKIAGEWKGHGPRWGKARVKVSCPERKKRLKGSRRLRGGSVKEWRG